MKHFLTSLLLFTTYWMSAQCIDTVYIDMYHNVELSSVTSNLNLIGDEELAGFQLEISYNPEIVAFGSTNTQFLDIGLLVNANEPGLLRVFWTETGGNSIPVTDPALPLVEIIWQVLDEGDAAIEILDNDYLEVVLFGEDIYAPCVELNQDPVFLEGSQISGRLLLDRDDDCVADNDSVGYAGVLVKIESSDYSLTRITNSEGYYSTLLPEGTYTVTPMLEDDIWQSCEASVEVVIDDILVDHELDFAVNSTIECPIMTVDISTPRLRRCFDTNYYFVNWANEGSELAESAYISIALDPALNFVSCTAEDFFYQEETHSVVVNLGDVEVFANGSFNIRVEVQCEGVELGQTHCTTAYIYPNTPCETDDEWSGAELQVEARCVNGEVVFTITNIGEGPMTEQTDFVIIEDEVMYEQPSIMLMPQEQVEYTYEANGSTYVAVVSQPTNFHYGEMIGDAIELCGTNDAGTASLGYITMYSNFDSSPHVDEDCTENIGSYDPNDKQAWPKGFAGTDLIENYISLDYMIRFQNTGTDTAFNIVVKDTLSEHLDLSSLRLGVSSHDYDFSIEGERTLVWRFNNILLPDSTTNLEGSNGFIKFTIDQVDGNPDGTLIDNQASIYFDFNDPIVTNVVRREVGSNFVSIGVNTIDEDLIPMDIFPNPTNDMLRVEGAFDPAEMHYQLSNMNAQIQKQGNLNSQQISVQDISQGVYILQVLDKNEKVVARRKIVVIK